MSCASLRKRSIDESGPKSTRTTEPSRSSSDPDTVALQDAPGPSAGGGGGEAAVGFSAGGAWVRLPVSRRRSDRVRVSSSTRPMERSSSRYALREPFVSETVRRHPSSAMTRRSTRYVNLVALSRSTQSSSIVLGSAGGANVGPSRESPQPASATATATARAAEAPTGRRRQKKAMLALPAWPHG